MDKFWVVASDVYKKNIKSVSFIIMLLAPFIFGGAMYLINALVESDSTDTVAIVSEQPELTQAVMASLEGTLEVVEVSSKADAEKQLADDDIKGFLVLTTTADSINGELFSKSSPGQTIEMTIQQILSSIQGSLRAANLNITQEQVASLNQPAQFTSQNVSFDADGQMTLGEDNSAIQAIISYVGTILLFVFIITYSGIISQEIASEKGTRIMEVILSSTRAQVHFYGKLVGILLVALTQIVVYVAAFAIGYYWFKDMEMVQSFLGSVEIREILGTYLLFTIIYTILGILIYAVLSALCGSLVNKAEDTSKAILPITYLALAGYMLGLLLGMTNPDSVILRVTSYIPFLSSFIMPVRLANETVGAGGALVSIAVLIVSIIALTLGCAKMYKSNVLIYNDNGILATLKQSIRLMKN